MESVSIGVATSSAYPSPLVTASARVFAATAVLPLPVASVSIRQSYTRSAVERAFARAGWTIFVGDTCAEPTLHWSDFSAIPWDSVLDGRATASAQYLKTGLVRKADLLHYMRKHGAACRFPPTIVGDIEDDDDVDELIASWRAADTSASCAASSAAASSIVPASPSTSDGSLWLLKPSRANRGEGIAVLRGGDEASLRTALAAHPRHRDWLLQCYVLPLLLPRRPQQQQPLASASEQPTCGLKCHLRLHVLAVGALSVWVHDAPLVLLASEQWAMPTASVLSAPATSGKGEKDGESVEGVEGREGGNGDEGDNGRAGGGLLPHLTNHCQQARGSS